MISTVFYTENCFSINNVKVYQPTIIFTKNAEIRLCSVHEYVIVPPHTIAFIEKGVNFNVSVLKKGVGIPYHVFVIDNITMASIHQLFEKTNYHSRMVSIPPNRALTDKVFLVDNLSNEEKLWKKILNSKEDHTLRSCKLAYLLSKIQERDKLFISMKASIVKNFSDKIREIIEEKPDKKWKLSDIAEKLYCSEITIRKKLEKENVTFNQLIYDVRMEKAAKLILSSDCSVTEIATAIGISSASYFIKQFKMFFGITPKKYYLSLKK
ncbi:helix-turn-helix transcriptional regulator [Escherichia albertii]|nr:helix-turn-helix transcriptional regulator [Escherichia albertii]